MFICEGKVVGFRSYEKNGQKKTYVQVVYKSKIDGYVGERACACLGSDGYKIGDKVKVADDFMRPELIEE